MAHVVPNIEGTKGHKIKTRNHKRYGAQCVIEFPINRNPAKSLQEISITVFGPHMYNSLAKYPIDVVKTKKF